MSTEYTKKWNQQTIKQWGEDTFGPCHPGKIAHRMASEVTELLELFEKVGDTPVDRLTAQTLLDLQLECADIAIFLDQISESLMADLDHVKNYKMEINQKREWAWDPERGETRHVSEVKENIK